MVRSAGGSATSTTVLVVTVMPHNSQQKNDIHIRRPDRLAVLPLMIRSFANFEGRLTKRVLMTLPVGMLLQSNGCIGSPNTPAIEVMLGDTESRLNLWRRVRSLRLDGTKFYGFADDRSYRLHMAERELALLRTAVVLH